MDLVVHMTWSKPDGDTYCPKCGQLEAIVPRHNSCLDCVLYSEES